MKMDLETQLRDYAGYVGSLSAPVELEEIFRERIGHGPVRSIRDRVPKRRWPRWATGLAAAVVVLLLVGGLAWLVRSRGRERAPVISPTPTTTTTSTIGPDEAARAVSAVEALIRALNDGDLEGAYDLTSPTVLTPQPAVDNWLANDDIVVYPINGTMLRPEDCEVTWFDDSSTDRSLLVGGGDYLARVECQLELADPLFLATGGGTLVWPFLIDFDYLVAPLIFEGASFAPATRAFVEYAELYRPDEYHQACQADVYPAQQPRGRPSSFASEYVAFRTVCRQLYVQLMNEVAEWVLAGRPQP